MKPTSTSKRPWPRRRRTRAGSRTSFTRRRAPSSVRSGCMRSCREWSCVERTVVWKSSSSSRLALETRRTASWSALRRSPALRDLADGILRLLLEFGQRLIGAALQFLDLGGLALLPLAGDFLLAPVEFDNLLAQADL